VGRTASFFLGLLISGFPLKIFIIMIITPCAIAIAIVVHTTTKCMCILFFADICIPAPLLDHSVVLLIPIVARVAFYVVCIAHSLHWRASSMSTTRRGGHQTNPCAMRRPNRKAAPRCNPHR
jgi:hypothetical protein